MKKKKKKQKVCPICNGDGYVRGKTGMVRCVCVKKKLYKNLGKFCNMSNEKFDTQVNKENYGINTIQGKEISYDQLINYVLLHYIEEKKLQLYFQGPKGTGKTLLANKLIGKIVKIVESKDPFEKGSNIKTAAHIISSEKLLKMYGNFKNQDSQNKVNKIVKKKVLIIDDFLQNENLVNFKKQFVNWLLKERSSDNYITIILSNRSVIEVVSEIDDKHGRLNDIFSDYQILKFKGKLYKSYRGKNKKNTLDNMDLSPLEGVDISEI